MKKLFQSRDAQIALGLSAAIFLLYLLTLAPDVVDGDGGEFQFAAWNFSFVHPTGYPLYLILGGVFQHLLAFVSTPAYWLNFFTALNAAGAVGFIYLIVRQVSASQRAAMLAAFSFGVSRMFWFDALAAEAYALHAFFVALLIWLALRWQNDPSTENLTWFALTFGFALTHHRSIILWIPAFALFFGMVWRKQRASTPSQTLAATRSARAVLRFAFYLLMPLLLYLYIPIRAPLAPYANFSISSNQQISLYDNTVTGFSNYVLGRSFQSELRWDATSAARLAAFPQLLFDQFTFVGVALGLLGIIAMMKRRAWARLILLSVGALTNLFFAASYHIGDIAHYYIPIYLVVAIWIGAGLAFIFEWLASFRTRFQLDHPPVMRAFFFAVVFFLLPYNQIAANFILADRSNETNARGAWLRYLETPAPKNAILISNDRDEIMPLWYLQFVEQRRRDVVGLFPLITSAPGYENVGRLIDRLLDSARPVYLIKAMPGIETKFWLEDDHNLIRVIGRTRETPPQIEKEISYTNQLRVKGFDAIRQENLLRVAVFWQARAQLNANYISFVQLFDARGNKIAQGNDHQVGGEYYPTRLWMLDEVLRDEHALIIPDHLAPGAYRIGVGMYTRDRELLGEPVEIGTVTLR